MAPIDHMSDAGKHLADMASVGVVAAALLEMIPEMTAIAGLVWFVMRIYQTWLEIRLKQKELDK